jgi:hypothetical protein
MWLRMSSSTSSESEVIVLNRTKTSEPQNDSSGPRTKADIDDSQQLQRARPMQSSARGPCQ